MTDASLQPYSEENKRVPVIEPVSFWFVWNKHGRTPKYRHDTYQSAVEEATRLAEQHRGAKFIVLEAVSKHGVPYPSDVPTSGEPVNKPDKVAV